MTAAASDDAAPSAGSDDVIELFVGQVVALFPLRMKSGAIPGRPVPTVRRIFPRSPDPGTPPESIAAMRARTYSLFVDAPGHGILTVGDHRIEVVILELDVSTPRQATVFRISAIAGRTIEITGVVVEPPLDAAG
ncbi:hypothetical protein [Microbacterium oleivorans]|uniref:hypothetical protein n=2 Tax=Microbacterium TaxID=33882 RepID=UPI00203A50C5|nr:hypothetical protein [Microbacterium oleivorans]MCM3695166.1 hypothetical protein [Microbacterium oleivorans]